MEKWPEYIRWRQKQKHRQRQSRWSSFFDSWPVWIVASNIVLVGVTVLTLNFAVGLIAGGLFFVAYGLWRKL
jgi:hypothetical protein